ncbi:MAG: indole-3-glycerol-phosphate synthase [Candidatus Bathyarchaeia archaeon]
MVDFLDMLAHAAKETLQKGYYKVKTPMTAVPISLKKAILECKNAAVISELKVASPSMGIIRRNLDACEVAKAMANSGAVGISVLTEPKYFHGSLEALIETRKAVRIPILMKDIIISPEQIEAASQVGANAILLIQAIFNRGYGECSLGEMIEKAHSKGIEVLLETHNETEFCAATNTDADLIGINNRDLTTLKVDLSVTKRILERNGTMGKIIVSESGIGSPADLCMLRSCGAQAFLIGSAIMLADDITEKIRAFVKSL